MDPRGATVVVTGASSGLGEATAVALAAAGARVLVVGRDPARTASTARRCRDAGGQAEVILGDVSTRSGVAAVGDGVLQHTERVDVLINNAGGVFPQLTHTADGVESTLALNTLGYLLLERALHPALVQAKGRVVNTATGFLDSFPITPSELLAPKAYSGFNQYGYAKLATVMLTVEQAERFAADGVTCTSLWPGIVMGTRFGGASAPPALLQRMMGPLLRLVGWGATLAQSAAMYRAAAFDDVPSGSYLVRGRVAPLPLQAQDPVLRKQVVAMIDGLAAG